MRSTTFIYDDIEAVTPVKAPYQYTLTFMTKDERHTSPVTASYTTSSKGPLNIVRIVGIAEKLSVGKLQRLLKDGAGGSYSNICHSKC